MGIFKWHHPPLKLKLSKTWSVYSSGSELQEILYFGLKAVNFKYA